MKKETKRYELKFPRDVIDKSIDDFKKNKNIPRETYKLIELDRSFTVDDIEKFYRYYNKKICGAELELLIYSEEEKSMEQFQLSFHQDTTRVIVTCASNSLVDKIINYFDEFQNNNTQAESKYSNNFDPSEITIFIGHGGEKNDWKILEEELERHRFNVVTFENQAKAGENIADIVHRMSDESTFAVLVLTPDDKQEAGNFHPRLNVIHEVGLFQGKLGNGRTIMVVNKNVKIPSNIGGIYYHEYEGDIGTVISKIIASIRDGYENN